ncbi:ABC transporter permease [Streptomyces sp. NPDC050164]|uniref:ABC transporter permease n=1 Tax=Streptomyces sp. NPDC050164 TaxID=3365605 RepID=UPI00378F8F3A
MTLGVWFLLGFFLFAAMLAAAAARVSRQEDLQGVVQPVMLLITMPFVLGIALLSKDAHDPLIEWLSLVPPLSPILMPARMLLGIAPAWQIGLSLVLAVAALAGMTRVAGRMYAAACCAAAPAYRSPKRCGCVSPLPPTRPQPTPYRKTLKEHLMSIAVWIAIGIAVLIAIVAGIKKNRG